MKKTIILFAVIVNALGAFAQKAKADDPKYKAGTVLTTYSCPMHPEVTSDKPGKCSKCGMDLNLSKKEKLKREVVKQYSCPTHAEVVSSKSGKCPKCGSNLNLSKKEQMKWEVMKLYTCPMHPEEISDKSGNCPKCGMKMEEKKSK